MSEILRAFVEDESGTAGMEYLIVVSGVSLLVYAAYTHLGDLILELLNDSASKLAAIAEQSERGR